LANIWELILVGLYEGLVWFPFVLGVGILYRYIKIIDISIEGVAVMAGISTVYFFNASQSYFFSLLFAVISAGAGYFVVFLLIRKAKVHPILAGIIFTLLIHSLSAIIIGESFLLQQSMLFSGVFSFSWITLLFALVLVFSVEFFFRTNAGLQIRFAGQNQKSDFTKSSNIKILTAFLLVSVVIGSGVFIYIHKQGVARSGSGFEFLIVSLGSFLLTDKLTEGFIRRILAKKTCNHSIFIFLSIIKSPVFKSLAGSVLFQIIAIFVIFYSPNPSWWKLLFAVILLFGVVDFRKNKPAFIKSSPHTSGIFLKNINFSYKNDFTEIPVFTNLNCHFQKGINIIAGDNGSGKTSLLKIIQGTISPDSGVVEVNSEFKYPKSIFYINQNPYDSMNKEMTVFENLSISLAKNDLMITRFKKLKILLNTRLKEFNLPLISQSESDMFYQLAGNLSGGQAQRVLLFMSVLNNPDIILADEPSSGMDNDNFKNLLGVMQSFSAFGKLIIIVTHDERLKKQQANHYLLSNGILINQTLI